ncbi:MAG TPA: c-type cytochrome domain-containing protein [Bacteroidota bacterium]|nr:c-type cytochrome domain-containing protein [Bacteroidota bacterium]
MRRSNLIAFIFLLAFAGGCTDMGINPPVTSAANPDTTASVAVSFSKNVLPIFDRYGCTGCHGGTNGLVVGTVADLLKGGIHGPAIVPGNADSSLIMKKTSPNPPFGDRMPQGGPYCPDSVRAVIAAWINQGAKDN